MAKSLKKSSVKTVIIAIASILLIAVAVGALVSIGNSQLKAKNGLTLWYNDEQIQGDNMIFPARQELRIDLKSQSAISEYSIVINPNVTKDNDFVFMVNGEEKKFSEEKNLTGGFYIEKHEDHFIFAINNDFIGILRTNYPQQTIECEEIDFLNTSLFVMEISAGESIVKLPFTVNLSRKPTGVRLDKDKFVYEQQEDDKIE